jgi:arsenical pump membrane protein
VISALGGTVLLAVALVFRRLDSEELRAHISPALFVYIAGLFVVVKAVEAAGITGALVAGAAAHATDPASAAVAGLLASAALSNLVNNLPAILVFLSGAPAALPPHLVPPFLFGALAGADLGPNLTPVGALSTMLWLVIVRRRGLDVSAWDFIRLGLLVTPAALLVAGLLIALGFR